MTGEYMDFLASPNSEIYARTDERWCRHETQPFLYYYRGGFIGNNQLPIINKYIINRYPFDHLEKIVLLPSMKSRIRQIQRLRKYRYRIQTRFRYNNHHFDDMVHVSQPCFAYDRIWTEHRIVPIFWFLKRYGYQFGKYWFIRTDHKYRIWL